MSDMRPSWSPVMTAGSRRSGPGRSRRAMAGAVCGWSPVTMITRMPAVRGTSAMASRTSGPRRILQADESGQGHPDFRVRQLEALGQARAKRRPARAGPGLAIVLRRRSGTSRRHSSGKRNSAAIQHSGSTAAGPSLPHPWYRSPPFRRRVHGREPLALESNGISPASG